MLDKPNSNRPERRSTIISKELQKYNINMAALSEIRFTENSNFIEETGYTFYWSRKTSTDRSVSSSEMVFCQVCLRILNQYVTNLSQRFPLVDSRYCTLIPACALTMTNSPEKKSSFYNQINQILHTFQNVDSQVGWGCRVHQLHLCRGVRLLSPWVSCIWQ